MGTNLQTQNLSPDDFGGEHLNGCNEILVVSRPAAVEKVHADFLAAGCDVIETDTFGGTPVVLAEYGLGERAYELNRQAAAIARSVATDYSANGRPRFVAGSMGPTTKLPSLGHMAFREMERGFYIQAQGLADGGADLLVIETCQDPLQIKAAMQACRKAMKIVGREIPIQVQVTMETTGRMLVGTEIGAALKAGTNCGSCIPEITKLLALEKLSPVA